MFPSQRLPLAPGTTIGKYVLEAHLGAGGNGAVYAAMDSVLGRRVALKLLHPELVYDAHIAGRFRREAQAMAQLNHPNVVTVHDLVGEASTWAIVMELVEGGETLGSVIKREGRLAPLRAIKLIAQVAAGLGHAHARGVVHRDVKPANVMIVRHASGPGVVSEIAKISDFGIARLVHGEKRTQGQLTLGTLWYLAPEQAQSSSVDARADVYALGATLYEALTGRVVFPYDNVARVLAAALSEPPQPPSTLAPGIAPELDALVLRFIAKRPEHRPAHGDDARAALDQLEQTLDARSRAPTANLTTTPAPTQPSFQPAMQASPMQASPMQASPMQASPVQAPGAHLQAPSTPMPAPMSAPPGQLLPAMHTPQPAPFSTTPTPPPLANVQRAAATPAEESQRLGMAIGIGVVALVTVLCLASSFLCVITGALR